MSQRLVGGTWVGSEFGDDRVLCLCVAQWGVMCYPRPSFPPTILPSSSSQPPSHLTPPLSDLLSLLYPTPPTLLLFFQNLPLSFPLSLAGPDLSASRSSKYGNWQIAGVWLGRTSLYVSVKQHKDNFAVSITSTRGFASYAYGVTYSTGCETTYPFTFCSPTQ